MNIEEKVLECQRILYEDNNIEIEPSLEDNFDIEHGINSLGVVNFIVDLEDLTGMDFDNVLGKIRGCSKFRDIVDIIKSM